MLADPQMHAAAISGWFLAGGLAAVLCWRIALKIYGARHLNHVAANGLVIAAIIYVGFAAVPPLPRWIGVELSGVLLFAGFSWLGLKKNTIWIAVGWFLHIPWDLALHGLGPGSHIAPHWYSVLCLGFDLVIGILLLLLRNKQKSFNQ